jgi:hypothetical protein
MRLNRVIKKCTPINRHGRDVANKKTFSFDNMKDVEFPEMKSSHDGHSKSAGLSTMDYKSKFAETETASPKEASSLYLWGMTKHYKDNSNEIITEKHETPLKIYVPTSPSPSSTPYYSSAATATHQMVKRWDKYTDRYIDLYGIDTYHHYHSFPNYDYEHFDRLDEIYESEQKQYHDEGLKEYLDDAEYYDKYSDKYGVDRYNWV